jgi:hypothetical protein
MGRFRQVLVVVLVTACLAACSAPGAPTAPFTVLLTAEKPGTTTKPPSRTPPPFTPPASPAKVTAACPFLGTAELQQLLGTSEDLIATEQPPDGEFVPGTEFHCRYDGKYVHPWLLDLWITASAGSYRPAESLENYKKDCAGPVTPVPGAGEGAYFCDRAGTGVAEMVITGKRSQGENRLAIAYMVKHRDEVYAGLAKLLAERL